MGEPEVVCGASGGEAASAGAGERSGCPQWGLGGDPMFESSQIFDTEPLATLLSHAVGITSNGVLILPAGSRDGPLMGSSPSISVPFGFNWNVVQRKADFNLDNASGKPMLHNDTGAASGKDIYCYRSGEFLNSALAILTLCLCPPDKLDPLGPTFVKSFSGNLSVNSLT